MAGCIVLYVMSCNLVSVLVKSENKKTLVSNVFALFHEITCIYISITSLGLPHLYSVIS